MTSGSMQASGKKSLRFSVGRKAMALFGLVLLLAIVNVLMVRSMLHNFHHVGATVNVAGKLRMLSQRTAFEAMSLPFGSAAARQATQDVMQAFDRAAQALRDGGEVDGIVVQPLPASLVLHLNRLSSEWAAVKQNIQPVLEGAIAISTDAAGMAAWHDGLRRDVEQVSRTANSLIEHIVSDATLTQARTLDQMYLLLLFDCLVLGAAYVWTRSQVVTPLRELAMGCRHLASGNYQVRLLHASNDEIGEVANAFNHSADRIGLLVADLTQRQKQLARAQAMFRSFEESEIFGFYIYADGVLLYANAKFAEMLGVEPAAMLNSKKVVADIFGHAHATLANNHRMVQGGGSNVLEECVLLRPDGGRVEVDLCLIGIMLEGKPVVQGFVRDITDRNMQLLSQRLAYLAYQNTSEAMVITDDAGIVREVNPAFSKLTGYQRDEIIGQRMRILSSGRHDQAFYRNMWKNLHETGHWKGEIRNRRKSGEEYMQRLVIDTAYHDDGSVICHIGVLSDITKRKETELMLWRQANYDDLTELANRHMFMHHLRSEIARAHRKAQSLAVLFLDLDLFKQVNDSYGHNVGDDLLWQVARRLTRCVRETDMVARLGGDEFTIVLSELGDREIVDRICNNLQDCLSEPFTLRGGHVARLSASLGVAFYPMHGEDPDELLRHADMAMYRAKELGARGHAYYDQVQSSPSKRLS